MRSVQYTRVAMVEVRPGKAEETIRLAETGLLPVYRTQPGFAAYTVVKTGERSLISLSIWHSREQAERAVRLGDNWVKEHAADLIESMKSHVSEFGFFASAGELSTSTLGDRPTPTPIAAAGPVRDGTQPH